MLPETSVVAECVEVERVFAKRVIEVLRGSGLLLPRSRAKSNRVRGTVRIPVAAGSAAAELLETLGIPSELCADTFEVGSRGLRLVDLLRGSLPDEALSRVPRSYQVVGNIALVHLPEDLLEHGPAIGEAIARVSAGVRAVYSSTSTEGEFRVRRLVRLWGEDATETVHTEHGVRIALDIGKVYFNPTLSYEHWRVSEEVVDGERVLDLFSGVGPFSLHIASKREATCFAVDSNPWAVVYMLRSIALNRLRGRIVPVLSSVEEFLEAVGEGSFTRAIVDLPHRSLEYVDSVLGKLVCGGVVHVYALGGEEPPTVAVGGARLVETRRVLDYAPRKYVYGLKLVRVCPEE